jgi:hypothetical protein
MEFTHRNVMLVPRQPGQSDPVVAGLALPRIVIEYNAAIVYAQSNMETISDGLAAPVQPHAVLLG